MNWPVNLARKAIVELCASPARDGMTNALHLDSNEAPWAPPPSDASVADYNRYPERQPAHLRARLAGLYGVAPDQVMMSRGADDSIEILIRTFCEANQDSILICPPTFGFFKTAAQIQGAKIIEAPLFPDGTWDETSLRAAIEDGKPKLVFLCSPNNPTGNSIDPNLVRQLCLDYPQTLIVVDEAYIEFSVQQSLTSLMVEAPNLIVLRTLSKAYGLAGVRLGACLAHKLIIELLLKVLPPYPIARPVEQVVMRALTPAAMPVHQARIALIQTERARVADALETSPFIEKAYPSDGNFILITTKNNKGLLAALARSDIKIRDFGTAIEGEFWQSTLRLSIGSPEQNTSLLAALQAQTATPPKERTGEAFRKTKETDIAVRVNLDDPTTVMIDTGIGFFDHMLEQIAVHGKIGMVISTKGDLHIDTHHTVEDTALALGAALSQALGNKSGIGRYGFLMPMDEAAATIAVDLSGRPAMIFSGTFSVDHVGEFAAEMCPHFFQSLAQSLGAAIQINVTGDNTHHMIEACFKGVGRALRPAFAQIGGDIPSSKGTL